MTDPAISSGPGDDSASTHPRRVLGLFDTTSIVIGAIIGVGIFFTPSDVVKLTNSAPLALLAWGIGGLIALCGALTFAELGSRRNGVGAQYQIIRETYGPLTGFVYVFCNSTASVGAGIGIMALICARNIVASIQGPDFDSTVPHPEVLWMSLILIVGLATANIIGVRWGAVIQNLTVIGKVLTLLAITAVAIFAAPAPASASAPEPPQADSMLPLVAVMAALVPVLFTYGGWQQALWVSGEVKNPRRNLPRGILIGVTTVVIVYMIVNWAYLHLLGVSGVAASKTLASDAVATGAPGIGARAVSIAVAISAFGILNVQFLTAPRLIFAMSRSGQFFGLFGAISPRFKTPIPAITVMALIAIGLLLAAGEDGLNQLLTGTVFVDGIFFILTGAAVFAYRRKRAADDSTAFRMPGYPVVPALFVIGELGVVIGAYLDPAVRSAAIIGAIWIAAGVALYLLRFRRAEP